MEFLRNYLDKIGPKFEKGGKLEKLGPLYDTMDSFLFTEARVASGRTHVRDGADLKRVMSVVVLALLPAIFMAIYNTGMQANSVLMSLGVTEAQNYRQSILLFLGLDLSPLSHTSNFMHGLLYYLPIYIVTNVAGGFWEVLFGIVRKHEVNEGFLVTGMLFPLIVPATIPLWQVAIGISFGVVVGKEVFGGTGRNFVNPALAARTFLFFAYPAQISGDAVWVAVDGYTKATPLSEAAVGGINGITYSWFDSFMGFIPGSIGETSTFACLIGAFILLVAGVASWRIMLSVLIGMMGISFMLNIVGSSTNPMFSLPAYWHLVLGGFAFGAVFMATDPVTGAMTNMGKILYGLLIGVMAVLIRVVNPAFPEGMMLAILFGNVFAPLIDYYVVKGNIKRRMVRNGQ